ncbi:signal peptidase I [Candidatus Parcubacteria bacterium]|nr:signal peptidase I [Candidatus Parcubacteria bacterium]
MISKKVILAIAIFAGVLFLRMFALEGFLVRGDSMSPTILSGDYVFISKLAYKFGNPERGDIIVAITRDGQRLVKRIVGLPGEVVKIGDFKTNVDPEEYFAVGDNIGNSIDSRELGAVDTWRVKGRVFGALRLSKFEYLSF